MTYLKNQYFELRKRANLNTTRRSNSAGRLYFTSKTNPLVGTFTVERATNTNSSRLGPAALIFQPNKYPKRTYYINTSTPSMTTQLIHKNRLMNKKYKVDPFKSHMNLHK